MSAFLQYTSGTDTAFLAAFERVLWRRNYYGTLWGYRCFQEILLSLINVAPVFERKLQLNGGFNFPDNCGMEEAFAMNSLRYILVARRQQWSWPILWDWRERIQNLVLGLTLLRPCPFSSVGVVSTRTDSSCRSSLRRIRSLLHVMCIFIFMCGVSVRAIAAHEDGFKKDSLTSSVNVNFPMVIPFWPEKFWPKCEFRQAQYEDQQPASLFPSW